MALGDVVLSQGVEFVVVCDGTGVLHPELAIEHPAHRHHSSLHETSRGRHRDEHRSPEFWRRARMEIIERHGR